MCGRGLRQLVWGVGRVSRAPGWLSRLRARAPLGFLLRGLGLTTIQQQHNNDDSNNNDSQ